MIAAYNCGPTNVNKAIQSCKSNAELTGTSIHITKGNTWICTSFHRSNYIMNYYCDHNICPMVTELPTKTDTVEVNQDVHIEQIAKFSTSMPSIFAT